MTTYLPADAASASFPGAYGSKVVVLGTSYLGFLKVDFGSFIAEGVSAADLVEDASEADLIAEAGKLNNHPKLVNADHVSIMGLMDHAQMVAHVAKLRELAA